MNIPDYYYGLITMDWGSALAWMILSPLVIIIDISCIFSISHYKNNYHGTDLTLIMMLVPLILNAIFILPIPAILTLADFLWTQELCSMYVWIFCTLRLAQVLGLLCLSIQWVVFLRVKDEKSVKTATLAMPWLVLGTWVAAGLVAILPVGLVPRGTYYSPGDQTCAFLSYDWGIGFAMFFVIIIFGVFCSSVVCLTDATLLLKHMKRVAVTKYRAGRFYMPSTITKDYRHHKRNVQDRYSELNFSADLCRFIFLFVVLSFIITHLPYVGIQCVQLFYEADRGTLELITLWLVLAECVFLPHTLWMFSKRYRHGFVYFWKVHVLKNTSAEEDPTACMLQSYTTKGSSANGTSRGVSVYQNRILRSLPRGTTPGVIIDSGEITQMSPVRGALSQVFSEQSGQINGNITVHAQPSTSKKGHPGTVSVKVYSVSEGLTKQNSIMSSEKLSQSLSPPMSPAKRFAHAENEVQRSSSRSRQEWVEQMRRKHLPAIFVNDAFEKEDPVLGNENLHKTVAESNEKSHKKSDSASSLYYLSGEFHPDNLTSSFSKQLTESESDATSNQYDTVDISRVLDETSMSGNFGDQPPAGHSSASNSPQPPKKPLRKQQSVGKHFAKGEPETDDASIVLERYQENRRPLWLDDADVGLPGTENATIQIVHQNPKPISSNSSQRSNSPSIHFDEDVDRGFEEALAIGYASVSAHESLSGSYFESIQEESEDRLSRSLDDGNPFLPEDMDDSQSEASFVTKAVVSKRQRNYSSESDNPFDKVPMSSFKPHANKVKESSHAQSNGNGDSGRGTWTDYSNDFIDDADDVFNHTSNLAASSISWPDEMVTVEKSENMSFDSDFSEIKLDEVDVTDSASVSHGSFNPDTKITRTNSNNVEQINGFDPAYF